MTPTEKAKRSDALYYATAGATRRVLCEMVANREADLEDVQAENARLREQVDAAHMSRLLTENENESLRELCADMLHDAMENICSKAHWCDEKSWQTCNDEKCGNRLYVEMARELGVEVSA